MKVTVTDRQLTEEPTAYSIDRPVVGSVGNADPTLDYAGTFVAWAIRILGYEQDATSSGSDSAGRPRFCRIQVRRIIAAWRSSGRAIAGMISSATEGASRSRRSRPCRVRAVSVVVLYGTRSTDQGPSGEVLALLDQPLPALLISDAASRLASAATGG